MKIGFIEFTPTLVPTLAAIVMIALTLYLAKWQLNRAEEKRGLQAHYDRMQKDPALTLPSNGALSSKDLLYRKVEIHGRFDFSHEIYIDNKLNQGTPGYHVITPFRDAASGVYVLINRGWLPAGKSRAVQPAARPLPGQAHIVGVVVSPYSRYLELSSATVHGRVWENLDFARYSSGLPYPVQPVLILQSNDTGDGLVRKWDRPDAGATMHMGYAVQWFAIAGAILIIYGVLNVKFRRG